MASISHVYNKFIRAFSEHCIFLTSLCVVTETPTYTISRAANRNAAEAAFGTNTEITVIRPPKETSEDAIISLLRCISRPTEAQRQLYSYNGTIFCVASQAQLVFMVDVAGLEYLGLAHGNGVMIIATYSTTVSMTFPAFLLLAMLSALRPGAGATPV